jgi:predicted nucleic acid-binding protein
VRNRKSGSGHGYAASARCRATPRPTPENARSARLFLACRSAGRTPRSSNDCLIARIAIEHELVLLHSDRDFEAIAHVEPKLKVYA